ncbi:MAG: hypothetical protein U0992_22770 [Planctomycetaceae bacterium]
MLRLIRSLWYPQIVLDLPFEPQAFVDAHEAILDAIEETGLATCRAADGRRQRIVEVDS